MFTPTVYTPGTLSPILMPSHRWDRHGRVVCFDSTHEGSRQVYVAQPASTPVTARDASVLTARGRHVAARHVAVFGARRAGFVAGLVRQAEDEVGWGFCRRYSWHGWARKAAPLSYTVT